MRAWEPEPGESSKAFTAFKIYRDMGPGRSIDRAWEIYSGRQLRGKRAPGRFQQWSRDYDWVERIKAMEARDQMIVNEAIEEQKRTSARDFAERQERLRLQNLANAEKAAEQEAQMLNWPLARQETIRPDKDGEMAVHIFEPVRWNKNSIKRLHDIAAHAAGEPERIDVTTKGKAIRIMRANPPTSSTNKTSDVDRPFDPS